MATALHLVALAGCGGGIDIESVKCSDLELQAIAGAGKDKGAKLIIRDAARLTDMTRIAMARASPGNVTFVF